MVPESTLFHVLIWAEWLCAFWGGEIEVIGGCENIEIIRGPEFGPRNYKEYLGLITIH